MFGRHRARGKLQAVIGSWVKYREIVLHAMGAEQVTPVQEETFLKQKAQIAAQLQDLVDFIPPAMVEECRREFGKMTELLKRHTSLKGGDQPGDWSKERFEGVWHEYFIFLNKLKGAQLVKKTDSAPVARRKSAAVPTGFGKQWAPRRSRVAVAGPVRFVLWIAIIALVIYGVSWGLGVSRDASGRFVTDKDFAFATTWANLLNSANGVVDDIVGFFKPVSTRYGPLWTIALIALLMLSIGYIVFVRG